MKSQQKMQQDAPSSAQSQNIQQLSKQFSDSAAEFRDKFSEFQQQHLSPILKDQELLKKSSELFTNTNETQKQKFYHEVDAIIKNSPVRQQQSSKHPQLEQQQPQHHHILSQQNNFLNNGIDITTPPFMFPSQDFNQNQQKLTQNWQQQQDQNQNQNFDNGRNNVNALVSGGQHPLQLNQSYSLNQSSLFNDSKLVPFDSNHNGGHGTSVSVVASNEDYKLQTANFQNFFLPTQESYKSLTAIQNPLFVGGNGNNDNNQEKMQTTLIAQYEQVLQMMHIEIQKLMKQNQELSEQKILESSSVGNLNRMQMQYVVKEKDDLVDTLRQREQIITQLRLENDSLNNRMIDIQSRFDSHQTQSIQQLSSEATLRSKNEQLLDRLRKLEGNLRQQEQQNFELEQMNRNLKRDLKHQTIVNEQLQSEHNEMIQKREILERSLQDLKNKISEQIIQIKQLNNVIQQQQIELTNIANAELLQDQEIEITSIDNQKTKELLNECEQQKVAQFQLIEKSHREIQNLKTLLRRYLSLIQTHREAFGDLADVNYDYLFKDLSNINLNYQLPQANFQLHLSSNISKSTSSKVKFDDNHYHLPFNQYNNMQIIKHKMGPGFNENQNSKGDDDYYKLVDNLTQYIRENQNNSVSYSSPSKNRQQSAQSNDSLIDRKQYNNSFGEKSLPGMLSSQQPTQRSILKNSQSRREGGSAYQGGGAGAMIANEDFEDDGIGGLVGGKKNANNPVQISWLSSNEQQKQAVVAAASTKFPSAKGRSPERKPGPNIEGLKATLASLIEEKSSLEKQMKSTNTFKSKDDVQFDLDIVINNIKNVQEKIQKATAAAAQ